MNHEALLQDFKKAYRNLQPQPLIDAEDLKAFRVPYGENVVAQLVQLIEDGNPNDTFFFTGSRGCGKSTLLAELCQRLKPNHCPIFFSVAEAIEQSAVNPTTLFFGLAIQLMLHAERAKLAIPKTAKEQIYKWFVKRTHRTAELSGHGVNGVKLLKQFQLALKLDATFREALVLEFQDDFGDLLRQLDEIGAFIEAICSQDLLVVIDDLNNLDLALLQEMFHHHLKTLIHPSFRIIYAIPNSLLGDRQLRSQLEGETQHRIIPMPVTPLFQREPLQHPQTQPNPMVMDTLIEILRRRVPVELATAATIQQMVLYSGGNLRELIRIAKECCRLCLVKLRDPSSTEEKIKDDILDQTIHNLKGDDGAGLSQTEITVLKQIQDFFMPHNPREDSFLKLLHSGYIIDVDDPQRWYAVRPVVAKWIQG